MLLKCLTLLFDWRLREWEELANLLPPSQNGFMAGRRTNNNTFIVRCLAERTMAEGKQLYVVSVDLSNAFPSVNRATLWVKLHHLGVRGPLVDLFKHVYEDMRYLVKGEENIFRFSSTLGVLIGDPVSPMLWNLFFTDFSIPVRPDDAVLCGRPLSHLEHADDILIFSTTRAGLQAHLCFLERWAALNRVQIDPDKTWAAVCGRERRSSPIERMVRVAGAWVAESTRAVYVGMNLDTSDRRLFSYHCQVQTEKAHRVSSIAFSVDKVTGTAPVEKARLVYLTHVVPFLIAGADICPDTVMERLKPLEGVQVRHLPRILRLGSRSARKPLFSELGLWPLRSRRLDIALRYAEYLLQRPRDSFVSLAMQDPALLAGSTTMPCWWSDLRTAVRLSSEGGHAQLQQEEESIGQVRLALRRGVAKIIHGWVRSTTKMQLLKYDDGMRSGRGRQAMALREYLCIPGTAARTSLTRFLVGENCLAMERMRWSDHNHPAVPPELRLCRFCASAVEDEVHAAFRCTARQEIVQVCDEFYRWLGKCGWESRIREWVDGGEEVRAVQWLI